MQEKAKELLKKLLEYWNKWSSKQKTIIISITAGVILLIGILVAVLSRTRYALLYTFEDTKTASQAVSVLRDNSITTKLASDNLSVKVDEKSYSDAIMLLATSDLSNESFGIASLLDTSITTTNGERLIRQHLYLKSEMVEAIKAIAGVKNVVINYMPKDTSNRILVSSQNIPVSVLLETDSTFKKSSAQSIATYVAYAIGNENTDNVKIVDQKGVLLYDGPEDTKSGELDYSDKIATREYMISQYKDTVTSALLMNGYTKIDVAPNLNINFDKVEELFTEYVPIEGENFGVLIEYHSTESEGTTAPGNVVGTDSNDEVDYYTTDGSGGKTSSSTEDDFYQPSVRVTNKAYDIGVLSAEESSIAVTAVKVVNRTRRQLELAELLEDITYDDFVLQNSEMVQTKAPDDLIMIISMATGIPEDNIQLNTYQIYSFEEEVAETNWSLYLQIALAVILFAFLVFVIVRGLAPVEVTELEPELSVEQLLATTKESQSLEDIEFSEQSETRKMIEKFFAENPEAVAQLLRNWLNDDWE